MVAGLEVISDGAALDQVELWRSRLDELLVQVGEHVFRREVRLRLRDYVKGLLAQVGRKNTWQIAEYVGHVCGTNKIAHNAAIAAERSKAIGFRRLTRTVMLWARTETSRLAVAGLAMDSERGPDPLTRPWWVSA